MKENDIRPEQLLNRYLELSAGDAERCFAGHERNSIACVACGGAEVKPEFEKNGFAYATCTSCSSLYQTPRPTLAAFEAFYRDSTSSRYWADVFFPAVAEARRERIFKPRATRLSELCVKKGLKVDNIIDVGAGYGILLDEWRVLHPDASLLAIEPSRSLANECRAKGLDVVEDIAENVKGYENHADLVVCFEVLEHVYDPLAFIKDLSNLARPGGYIFISTLGVDGFDIQMLWDKSNSIFPPHHINFMSVAGFRHLFERAGLVDIEVSTPGVLDVNIVQNAAQKDRSILEGHKFIRNILADDKAAADFQIFLANNMKSSHTWVIGQKPNL